MVLGEDFFNRDTEVVAKELLGKFLVRQIGGREIAAMITETEAYDGFKDRASHAFRGKTPRSEVMFGHPGFFYVYLVYGMYYMLNIVTREHGYPAAVLIRGIVKDGLRLDGPGKVTKCLNIDKSLNLKKAEKAAGLWVEDHRVVINPKKVKKTARIGVSYAGPLWSAKKRRFVVTYTND